MKTISVIIPFFNERESLNQIYSELLDAYRMHFSRYRIEIILMDNHSTDGSHAIAVEIARGDERVRVIRLSRNFGYQANILTGYLNACGDAVVQLDADGEDDPRLIAELIKHWEQGFKVVYGVRKSRVESSFISMQRKFFYRLVSALSPHPVPIDAGDFRLLDREVVHALSQFKEANPYLRGLITLIGHSQVGIPYERRQRFGGNSKFSWWDYLQLAWDGITSLSRAPLAFAGWLSVAFLFVSFAGFVFYLILHFAHGRVIPGFTTLVLVQFFVTGMQMLILGIFGTYLGRIFDEVKARPRYIVESQFPADRGSSSEAHPS